MGQLQGDPFTESGLQGLSLPGRIVCLWGPVRFALSEDAVIRLGTEVLSPPYAGCVLTLSGEPYFILFLRLAKLLNQSTLPLHISSSQNPTFTAEVKVTSHAALKDFLQRCASRSRQDFAYALIQFSQSLPMANYSPFITWVREILPMALADHSYKAAYVQRCARHLLYLEVSGLDIPENTSELLLLGAAGIESLRTFSHRLKENALALLAFLGPARKLLPQELTGFALKMSHGMVWLDARDAANQDIIAHLAAKPGLELCLAREFICSTLMTQTASSHWQHSAPFLARLQQFLTPPAQLCTDPNLPFNFYLDQVIACGNEGVFFSGWKRDAHNLLQEIRIISDLGLAFTAPLTALFTFPRRDVAEAFKNTPYGNMAEDHGFAAFIPLPNPYREILAKGTRLHSFRFEIVLADGTFLPVIPLANFLDDGAARDYVLRFIPSHLVSDEMLEHCITPAVAALQARAMQRVKAGKRYHFGKQPVKPRYSIIIPLYRQLDFIKTQFATLQGDAALKKAELIYILDSPEQEHEVCAILKDMQALYRLPVSLLVMEKNSGYASANNAGAAIACGKMLVLMNSDVFPAKPGWLEAMDAVFAKEKKAGIVGAKLLFADGSLQHAGMYFSKHAHAFWNNMHYHKGFPANYPAAIKTRAVPAVTGACMMLSKELYDRLGGLSTHYVVGDFEDSDICLRAAEQGLASWYCAQAELYHLERQSMVLAEGLGESLAWRYNAALHHRRWHQRIAAIMTQQDEAA